MEIITSTNFGLNLNICYWDSQSQHQLLFVHLKQELYDLGQVRKSQNLQKTFDHEWQDLDFLPL